jgi:hypothetical protein
MGTFSGNWGGDTEGSRERQKGKVGETGDRVEDRERNTLESEDRIREEERKNRRVGRAWVNVETCGEE